MNPRERTIAIAVLAAVMLAAGAFLFHQFYLVPLREREERVRMALDACESTQEQIDNAVNQQAKLVEWRKRSLPSAEIATCQRKYVDLLDSLMRTSGFAPGFEVNASDSPTLFTGPQMVKKDTFITPLNFTVSGRANLSHLVRLLEEFYRQPLLHRIKLLSIKRPTGSAAKTRDLDIVLNVEAIIVSGAESRSTLSTDGKVAADNLANPPRDYTAIAAKDPFYGPPPPLAKPDDGPDHAQSVKLLLIKRDPEKGYEAWLYDDTDKTHCCLCPDSRFLVKNKPNGTVRLDAEVIRIDYAGGRVVFRVGDEHYAIDLDQTLAEALRKPLSEVQMRAPILTQAPGSNSAH